MTGMSWSSYDQATPGAEWAGEKGGEVRGGGSGGKAGGRGAREGIQRLTGT